MKKLAILSVMGLALVVWLAPAQAAWDGFKSSKADDEKEFSEDKAAAAEEAAPVDEALNRFKALENQKQNIARIEKQIEGEKAQLAEMQTSLSESYKLDLEKLQNGLYEYDDEKKEFVEKV